MTLHQTDPVSHENPLNELEDIEEDSLEQLLTQPAAAGSSDSTADVFSDLDNLLSDALQLQGGKAKARAYRQRLANGFYTLAEKAEMEAYVRQWDVQREWRPQADAVMFDTEVCTHCGRSHSHFVGYFERQRHRETAIDRWLSSTNPVGRGSRLPKERKVEIRQVPVCIECCAEGGY
jgi:hypothetical protein